MSFLRRVCVSVSLDGDDKRVTALSLAQPILKATYMTPCTMLDMLHHNVNFCHLWLTVEETLQRLPPEMNVSNQGYVVFVEDRYCYTFTNLGAAQTLGIRC